MHPVGAARGHIGNYLGHFLLAQRLLFQLEAAPQGRIVLVSSGLYTKAPEAGIEFDDLSSEKSYDPITAYGQSKLAMALFAVEFSNRFPTSSVTANALQTATPSFQSGCIFLTEIWPENFGMFLWI